MVDYFTYVSVLHQQEGGGDLGHLSESELKGKMLADQKSLDEGIGYLLKQGQKVKISTDSSKTILDLEDFTKDASSSKNKNLQSEQEE